MKPHFMPQTLSSVSPLMGFLPRKLVLLQLQHQSEHMIMNTVSHSPSPSPGPGPGPAPSPSPLQSSLSLPIPIPPKFPFPLIPIRDEGFHVHLLQLGMIIMAGTVGIAMLLCAVSLIRRICCSWRHNRTGGNTPILFHVNGDSAVSGSDFDDDEGALVDHPIWFIRTVGLQQSVIDSITVFVYRKGERLIDGSDCSVCLAEFQENDSLRLLPKCSHAFHIPCIDTWLRSHKNCPLCRAPVLHDSGAATAISTDVIVPEADSNGSGENQENGESSSVRNIGDEDDGGEDGETLEKMNRHRDASITQPMRRSVSMDSSSMFRDLNSDDQDDKITNPSSRIYKLASIAFQKRPRSPFSHNRKCSTSTHSRSHSSTLPL
ncbi:hypothetical protein HN51_013982 [Arachis hypogaea]|uniref:RING-type E3 ubiquitin transferase n=2 Tax=Arachis hypogaea TaxID=3818 RepID=A0A445DMZ3_ARAHY|nr:RING-H2 finger protein ATL54 [Arachis hypogaea]RYR64539.1 hypothetical protein Ahy_A03g010630 isoform A [Arachis hypogaea]